MRSLILLLSIGILLILQSCGPDFNTDFDPPPPNASVTDIFPEKIGEMKGDITRINLSHLLEGYSCSYGKESIVINVIKTPHKNIADQYFENAIVPNIDKMKNHFRENINGKWRASGTDANGRKWYGWVNNNWVFLLNGSDNKYFKMAIDAFGYVER